MTNLVLCRRLAPRPLSRRLFSTSAHRSISLELHKNDQEALKDVLPAYPYGPARWYKQSNLGLYGGQMIRFGNNVGEKYKNKTRRTFKPNIQNKRLFSRALDRFIQLRVSTRVLRTIDKEGGLDEYLLGSKEARIKELGESGWWLRWAIMHSHTVQKKINEQRIELGIPQLQEDIAKEQGVSVRNAKPVRVNAVDSVRTLDEVSKVANLAEVKTAPDPNSGRPVIQFRVGKGQHVYLTEMGWKRLLDPRGSKKKQMDAHAATLMKRLGEGTAPQYMATIGQKLQEQELAAKDLRQSQLQRQRSSPEVSATQSGSIEPTPSAQRASTGSITSFETSKQESAYARRLARRSSDTRSTLSAAASHLLATNMTPARRNQIVEHVKARVALTLRQTAKNLVRDAYFPIAPEVSTKASKEEATLQSRSTKPKRTLAPSMSKEEMEDRIKGVEREYLQQLRKGGNANASPWRHRRGVVSVDYTFREMALVAERDRAEKRKLAEEEERGKLSKLI